SSLRRTKRRSTARSCTSSISRRSRASRSSPSTSRRAADVTGARLRWMALGYGGSLAVHLAVAGAALRIPKKPQRHTPMGAAVTAKPKPKPKPDDDAQKPAPEPPAEVRAPRSAPKQAAAPPPSPAANTPPPKANAAESTAATPVPEIGLSMSGG